MEILRDMWDEGWLGRSTLVLLFVMVAMIPLVIWAVFEDQKEWQEFSVAHECKVVGHVRGSTQTGIGYGVTSNGQFGTVMTTTSTPSKTGYMCNDGVTYWR